MNNLRKGILLEYISLGWMAVEFLVRLIAGIRAHSILLVAFGLDSLLEIVSGVVLLWRLFLEKKHRQRNIDVIEQRVTKIVGWILILLAIYIVVSIYNLVTHQGAENSLSSLLIVIASLIFMPILTRQKVKVANAIKSAALKEDGMCNIVCAYMAATVLLGVVLTSLLNWWITPVAALLLVYFIAKEGLEGIRD